jgi:hypothetical protein
MVYLITPLCLFLSTLLGDRLTGPIVSGGVAMAINLVIMAASYANRHTPSFVFQPKTGWVEIAFAALVTFFHGFTLAMVPGLPTYIIGGLSSYSLFAGRCPESAVYRDNDEEFALGSNHYQRPLSNILLAVVMIVMDLDQTWLFIAIYFLHVLGIIAHPWVTIVWAIEQVSMHLLGSSPRASDFRILLGFFLNITFVAVCIFISQFGAKPLQVTCVLLAYVSSLNFMGKLGIIEPSAKPKGFNS